MHDCCYPRPDVRARRASGSLLTSAELQHFLAFCASLGWPGLALLAFAASTLLPVGSEWLLAIQLGQAETLDRQWFLLLVATLANTAGGAVTYGLGRGGAKLAHADLRERHARAAALVRRYGALAALAGWVPFIGDPITLLCGALRVPVGRFLLLSLLGRASRYVAIWLGVR
jgi:membrane protein YqaA with SNARE-associated domain